MIENYSQNKWKSLQKENDFSKKSENHSKRVSFSFLESSKKDRKLSLCELSKKSEIHSFEVIFTLFGKITLFFWSNFHLFWE